MKAIHETYGTLSVLENIYSSWDRYGLLPVPCTAKRTSRLFLNYGTLYQTRRQYCMKLQPSLVLLRFTRRMFSVPLKDKERLLAYPCSVTIHDIIPVSLLVMLAVKTTSLNNVSLCHTKLVSTDVTDLCGQFESGDVIRYFEIRKARSLQQHLLLHHRRNRLSQNGEFWIPSPTVICIDVI
jgi:hypothetical protein